MNDTSRYANRGEPTNLTAVTTRLRQLAKDQGVAENRLRHRLGVVVLADIICGITISDADERVLIKGGTAMMLRFGLVESRFSKDLDAMLRGSIDPFVDRLRERGRTAHHGWTFVVAKDETIEVPGMLAKPRRLTVKMSYKGRFYSTIQLEVAPEEGAAAEEYDLITTDDLATLGFDTESSQQQVLTVRYQVAQKLHACTSRSPERRNDRAHDLVDLALLEQFIRDEPAAVRAACAEIFALRGQHDWPPLIEPEGHWNDIYTKAAEGLEDVVPATLDAAVTLVNDLIQCIDAATSQAATDHA